MEKLTIYTATYNREKLLTRLYNSLKNQTNFDFIWMIVDDGSTDNTKIHVEKWKQETENFKIEYFYKENGGVHTARDFAYKNCKTELIVGVDSDDWIKENAVESIISFWNNNGSEKYGGIFCPCIYQNGEYVGTNFPKLKSANFQEFSYKYKFKGDKLTILRTDIINRIPESPTFRNEKLVPENYKWIQLPNEYPFLIMQIPVKIVEYQNDGYTANSFENVFENLNGFRAYYRQEMISVKYIKPRLKGFIGYIATSILLRKYQYIKESPYPFFTFLLTPFGVIGLIFLKLRRKMKR